MTRRAFTPWDAALFALLLGGALFWALRPAGEGRALEVAAAGGSRTVPLGRPGTLALEGPLGTTVVELGPRGARVVSSPCPNRDCVRAGWISRPGEVADCVPNRVALRVAGAGQAPAVDAVAR